MNISPLTPGISSSAATATSSTPAPVDPTQSTNNMFLQLLTAQLENQSPIDPVDPTQFTSQLVQFNMLDELTQINLTLQQIAGTAPASSSSVQSSIQGAD